MTSPSNVADSVGHVQSVVVSSQLDVSLLGAVGSHKSVDLLDINLVQLLDGLLDVLLVGLEGDLQHQSVTVLNLLDGGLRGNRRLDHLVSIELGGLNDSSGVLGRLGQFESHGSVETGGSSGLLGLLGVGALQRRLLSGSGLGVWGELVH